MIRLSQSVISVVKICTRINLNVADNASILLTANSFNNYNLNTQVGKPILLGLKYSMAKKKEDKDDKKKKEK